MSIIVYIRYKIYITKEIISNYRMKLKDVWTIYSAVLTFFLIYSWYSNNFIYYWFAFITFILMIILSIYKDYTSYKWKGWEREQYKKKYSKY